MIVVEFTDDKFGKTMKAVSCIIEKAEMLKDIFEEDAVSHRGRKHHYEDDDDEDYERRYSSRKRYM